MIVRSLNSKQRFEARRQILASMDTELKQGLWLLEELTFADGEPLNRSTLDSFIDDYVAAHLLKFGAEFAI